MISPGATLVPPALLLPSIWPNTGPGSARLPPKWSTEVSPPTEVEEALFP